ncbi:tyrosine-type recombinase/integrase [Saccharopolyspora sp. NPDC049357]|uniref:tyrosine-type recombinase/integrase n=1 Tax=Saccharopolyspora sp. NPDC049357 TaxID=3154507 RepID=UPI003433F566
MAYGQQDDSGGWRARFKRPDGTWGSKSGFPSERAAENWGNEQEALIRRHMWIDPRDGETPFGTFAREFLDALAPRLEPSTLAKYKSHLDSQLLPQWSAWPLIGIFNNYVEIEKWVSELHDDYADSTVASVFATFSTMLNAAVRARCMPANPCSGIRVTSGAYESDRLVANPVQALRAAMRLHTTAGLSGVVLCLMDLYTGARWSELVGQQRHEYDRENRAICIQEPLKEIGGNLFKGGRRVGPGGALEGTIPASASQRPKRRGKAAKRGRTKSPAGTRWVPLPPGIATAYETLMHSHDSPWVFCTPDRAPLRRSNFRQRCWRPAWDGVRPDEPRHSRHAPAILSDFSFHEGRHSHNTWLTEDGVPEVARRARLGQKMKGIARVYDHVTPAMTKDLLQSLETRWVKSVASLSVAERAQLLLWIPRLRASLATDEDLIAISSPFAS